MVGPLTDVLQRKEIALGHSRTALETQIQIRGLWPHNEFVFLQRRLPVPKDLPVNAHSRRDRYGNSVDVGITYFDRHPSRISLPFVEPEGGQHIGTGENFGNVERTVRLFYIGGLSRVPL